MSRLSLGLSRLGLPLVLGALLLVDARTASSAPPLATPAIVIAPAPAPSVALPSSSSNLVAGPVTGRANGASYLHALGVHAATMLAPNSGSVGALVALPKGKRAADYGLEEVVPGIGRLRAPPARIEAFGFAHPDLRVEVAPPLHSLLDRVGQWVGSFRARTERGADGTGVLVGVADTGLDVTNPEMLDASGKSRVAWLLDLSLKPVAVYPDLEQKYGILDSTGALMAGAVLSKDLIDQLLGKIADGTCVEENAVKCAPSDEVGHGTHVTGIATSRGATGKYPGIAPAADIIAVRATRGRSDGIEEDDIVRAVQFMFDRADFEKKPMVVNLSIGSDFGPHDGSFLWEQTLAGLVGANFPGRAIVAAAGNSGSVAEMPIHQSVRVTKGATFRVPVHTEGADSGSVQVWVTLHDGADLKIGLDGPDGEWIAPVAQGAQNGKNTSDYMAAVIYGSDLPNSAIPAGSHGANVLWVGKWPTGNYSITFAGTGMAELYLQGIGDAALGGAKQALFVNGVREGTINLPATNASIIGVGCTVNRPQWTSIAGAEDALAQPRLDAAGGKAFIMDGHTAIAPLLDGQMCWFSSAGPTAVGVPKPEIAAPGALVVSAMSRSAHPGIDGSIFTNPSCPDLRSGKADARCLQIDDNHGIAVGTSMSTPVVAGVVALLLQKDPTLTQDKITALLQAGAHPFRAAVPFEDQSGPGEVDALGSLDALDQMQNPTLQLPAAAASWLTLSADHVAADGSTNLTAIVELRTVDGAHRADFFDKNRLAPVVLVDGVAIDTAPELIRRGPGVWFFVWKPPPGLGGSHATFGATFDGNAIVAERTVPIATDEWTALYASSASGSSRCVVTNVGQPSSPWSALPVAAAFAVAIRHRRRGRRS